MDPKSLQVEYSDDQIEEITRQIKKEMQEREQMKVEIVTDEMVAQESKLKILKEEKAQPKQISIFLIAKTSIDSDIQKSFTEEEKYEWLMNLSIIHLEWENIYKIEKLDSFQKLQVLYLQHNNISKIENLNTLENLEYLALDHNKITTIENLSHLKNLVFLKLNNNLIEEFNVTEIPTNIEYISLSQNPLKKKDYKKILVQNLQFVDVIDDEELTTETKFKLLGIFPTQYESYSKSYKEFQEKSQQTKKERSYLDKIKEATQKKQDDLISLKKKFKQLDVYNKEEEIIQEMNLTTKNIVLKQKQKTIEALNDTILEMSDYAKMHAKRIEIIHKNDPNQKGSLSNSLLLQNYIESREQDMRNNEYELEKIKMQKVFIQQPLTSDLKEIKEEKNQNITKEKMQLENKEEEEYEEESEYEGEDEEEENETDQTQSTSIQSNKNQ
ncbi:hypothetical protein TTHERM_00284050 (macronuclear) [Tetrahymena thermophila SB210]|uniref:Leucine rich repeat protein n=1 Tax=Tetrahymena thermophila (strain SB210) TaxID=312017 RepID=I7M1Y3_TETTS|nr:hypothetical protein TTHERM_00284050 [Tetrahymena thermophila SB210]EAR98015.2 hypothetical protein TTHERM_00284050 [Tetrahymena thermophila SB210]|eukprot:XP_001018260.2 hypothetical protein TTHERM_00284050 [Tetrahymena thermophila SB210]